MKKIIHVNQHHIKWNQKNEEQRPVFTVKEGRKNTYAREVIIHGPSKVVYQPKNPLSCGARAWIETQAEVELVDPQTYKEIHNK
jgi:hypothetical protein